MLPEVEEEDSADILSSSLQTLYDYAPITHSSPNATFVYSYTGTPGPKSPLSSSLDDPLPPSTVTLTTPDTQASNWSLHASSIWVGALYLADHLHELPLPLQRPDSSVGAAANADAVSESEIDVLELGAGAGLPGILLAKTDPRTRVTLSDYPDPLLIATLSANVERNVAPGTRARTCARVVPYEWGSDSARLLDATTDGRGYDLIIAADTLWNPSLHTMFLSSLAGLLRRTEDSRVVLVAGFHTGRYTIESFLERRAEHALRVVKIEEREVLDRGRERGIEAARRPWDVTRAHGEDEQARRRWVVWIELGWAPTAFMRRARFS